jgi:uncharacterized protein (DUF2235 family)
MILSNKIDLAIAWNFESIVLKAYRWLAENYQDGDRIFLFGFSRGAYQVRVISGMIEKVGLINKGNDEQIPFAYELYMDPSSGGKPLEDNPPTENVFPGGWRDVNGPESLTGLASKFKTTFSRPNVHVHLIGVWDTVSSIGVVRGKDLPGTMSQSNSCFFRHALALDEHRVKFLPEYISEGLVKKDSVDGFSEPEDYSRLPNEPGQERKILPRIKEVWFPGTHSDV